MTHPTRACPGPLSRRHFLKIGALGVGRFSPQTACRPLEGEGERRPATLPDTSVIFIWLPGGPPHMETYDMKPNAPAEYRGEFKPIKTNVPGIDICEHPRRCTAKIADKSSR